MEEELRRRTRSFTADTDNPICFPMSLLDKRLSTWRRRIIWASSLSIPVIYRQSSTRSRIWRRGGLSCRVGPDLEVQFDSRARRVCRNARRPVEKAEAQLGGTGELHAAAPSFW